MVITSAEMEQVVMVSLRHGTAAASLGADDDLEFLVRRIREAWPNVRIRVGGNSGFGNPTMSAVCERVEIRPSTLVSRIQTLSLTRQPGEG